MFYYSVVQETSSSSASSPQLYSIEEEYGINKANLTISRTLATWDIESGVLFKQHFNIWERRCQHCFNQSGPALMRLFR
jgi:hypothetical protein